MMDTDQEFYMFLGSLCVMLVYLTRRHVPSTKAGTSVTFRSFQRKFMIPYVMAMFADWLQGPHIYTLYRACGFEMGEIGQLFVVGFGSSMVFGVLTGSLADRFGRKANCMAYCVIYAASCMTKHSCSYKVLMVGRVLGGLATSILFSAFESWMVHEHTQAGFPAEWQSETFSLMTFYNGLAAIGAGLCAQGAATMWGYTGPFDVSFGVLCTLLLVIATTWTENFGDTRVDAGVWRNVTAGWTVLRTNRAVVLVGATQSLFEAAMYTFVFMWTPALEAAMAPNEVPHGIVFSTFMVCLMIGSYVFRGFVTSAAGSTVGALEGWMRRVFLVAAVALLAPLFYPGPRFTYLCFCVFEMCCGVYFPAMGTLRGKHVPGDVRATVMNFFRVGLNLLVLLLLLNVSAMQSQVFMYSAAQLLAATCTQHLLVPFAAVGGGNSGGEKEEGAVDEEEQTALVGAGDSEL